MWQLVFTAKENRSTQRPKKLRISPAEQRQMKTSSMTTASTPDTAISPSHGHLKNHTEWRWNEMNEYSQTDLFDNSLIRMKTEEAPEQGLAQTM